MIVPGRILVIDDIPTDREKKQVDRLIESLRSRGESVLFSTPFPEKETFYENVRLLVIDLLLAGQDKDKSYEMVATTIEKLTKKTSFFVIAIWSKVVGNARENIVENVKKAFRDRTQTDLRAVVLEPFGKKISPTQLMKKIRKSLSAIPECGLLLEVETSIESARDRTVSDIISTAEIPLIMEALKEEVGGITLSREMINLFLRVLSRHSHSTKPLQKCVNSLTRRSVTIDPDKYGRIHNLQSYYEVKMDETVWTGDVLMNKKKKGKYAVVISPACDFAQRKKRKIGYIKMILGTRIDHNHLMKRECLNKLKKQLNFKNSLQDLQKGILTDNLPDRYYTLTYLKDNSAVLYHLLLDFQSVMSLPYRKNGVSLQKAGYARVCRVDIPSIDDLLQAYSAYSSRIGTASIPKSVVDAAKSKIR